jgi:hypothetical protein
MLKNVVYTIGYIRFIKSKTEALLPVSEAAKVSLKKQFGPLRFNIRTHLDQVNLGLSMSLL